VTKNEKPKHYVVKTLGCKANLYDSQLIEQELQRRGWTPLPANGSSGSGDDQAALCIVNSCTVTDEADRQSRKQANRFARHNPGAAVVMTGCSAEVEPERLTAEPGIHYVIGNQNKPELVEILLSRVEADLAQEQRPDGVVLGSARSYAELLSRHPMDREWPVADSAFLIPPVQLSGHSDKTRAFLKIQEGCDHFCTYCIIPYGRGPSRSLRPREILTQVKQLVSEGVQEIIITGTNIGDYGTDWNGGPALEELLKQILGETSVARLRVSSLDPTEITPGILELMKRDPRFCPHFHVSLQSTSSRVLRLMKRRYDQAEVVRCLEAIHSIPAPLGGVFVGMDLITGFPGETEEEFEASYQLLEQLPWSRLHVFPYSEREGTPATRLPLSVPKHVRSQRARVLNELSVKRLETLHHRILAEAKTTGALLERILVEKPGPGPLGKTWGMGYTPNYLRVLFDDSSETLRNQEVAARPLEVVVDRQNHDVAFIAAKRASASTSA